MSERSESRLLDWGILLFCNLVWASQFVLAKLVQTRMGPLFATLFPISLAMLILTPLVRREQKLRAHKRRTTRRDVLLFAAIGVFGQVCAQLSVTWGVNLVPASNGALLSLTLPISTAIIAYFVLGERMTWVRWASFALAVVGVLQCSGIEWRELRFASGRFVLGNFLMLLSNLGSAFYNVFSKKLLDRYSPVEVLLYSYVGVIVCLLPITLYEEPESFKNLATFGPQVWLGLGLLAFFTYSLSMILFLKVLSRLDATQAALSNYLIPVFGVVIAAVALDEHLTAPMIIGGSVVLASTLLITIYEEHYVPRARARALAARSR